MLTSFTSDLDFRAHLNFHNLNSYQLERLHDVQFKSAIHKLKKLFLDPAKDLIFEQYSSIGRPAIDPTILIRSFILMQHFGFTSPYLWCEKLKHDDLLRFLIGCNIAPNSSSHYDFINRMTHSNPNLHTLFSKDKNFINKKSKLKKGEKLVNFSSEDSSSLIDKYLSDSQWDRDRFSYTLQLLFNAIAVVPSQELGLLPTENLILSGDGSSLHIHANAFGNKVKKEDPNGLTHRFSSPEADVGWDSDLCTYYYGFTLYNISHHDSSSKVDLPCFLSIEKASRHDALTTVSASAQLFDINPELHPRYMCFDSASDSYAIREFFSKNNVVSIIDVNTRAGGKNLYQKYDHLNDKGKPVCMNQTEMVYAGYDRSRYRHKYRCPLAMGKIDYCPFREQCSKSEYGRTIYIKSSDDPKLFGEVPYKSDKWKEIYKNRTSTERMNNRILNDYHLHSMKIRNQSKFLFFAIVAGINIHLDARVKFDS